MPIVRFEYEHPTPDGGSEPAVGRVECALLVAETLGGKWRSTRAVGQVLIDGKTEIHLSPTSSDQLWVVAVYGVPGLAEEFVEVPDVVGPIDSTTLVRVDPAGAIVGSRDIKRWSQISEQADAATARAELARQQATASAQAATVAANAAKLAQAPMSVYFPGSLTLTTGVATIAWPWAVNVQRVTLAVAVPATGLPSGVAVQLSVAGVPMFSQPPKLAVGRRAASVTPRGVDNVLIPANTAVTVDIVEIGATQAGADLVVTVWTVPA